jgi:HEAT repeat protein
MKKMLCLLLLLCCGCGKKSTEYWVEKMKDPDTVTRLHAVDALRQRTEEAMVVVPALIEALKDSDAFVRRDAIKALASFGEDARPAVPALLALHQDKDNIRQAAIAALTEIDPEAVAKFPKKKTRR